MKRMAEAPPLQPGYSMSNNPDIAFNYLLKHMSLTRTPQQKGISLLKEGKVIAAVGYDWITDENMFIHVAAEPGRQWMRRTFLYWSFHYPFHQQRVSRLTGWVEANNLTARAFNEHLGFKVEATLRGAGTGGQDVLLYVMHREDCRYV